MSNAITSLCLATTLIFNDTCKSLLICTCEVALQSRWMRFEGDVLSGLV